MNLFPTSKHGSITLMKREKKGEIMIFFFMMKYLNYMLLLVFNTSLNL